MSIHVNHCSSVYYYEQGVGLKESESVIFTIPVITTISNRSWFSYKSTTWLSLNYDLHPTLLYFKFYVNSEDKEQLSSSS